MRKNQRLKFMFTKKDIDALKSPPTRINNVGKEVSRSVYYYDQKVHSLAIAVASSGRKVFIFVKKIDGRTIKKTLQRYPDMTIDQARRRVSEMNANYTPYNPNQAVSSKTTLKQMFDRYMELHARIKKKSWKGDEYQFK